MPRREGSCEHLLAEEQGSSVPRRGAPSRTARRSPRPALQGERSVSLTLLLALHPLQSQKEHKGKQAARGGGGKGLQAAASQDRPCGTGAEARTALQDTLPADTRRRPRRGSRRRRSPSTRTGVATPRATNAARKAKRTVQGGQSPAGEGQTMPAFTPFCS